MVKLIMHSFDYRRPHKVFNCSTREDMIGVVRDNPHQYWAVDVGSIIDYWDGGSLMEKGINDGLYDQGLVQALQEEGGDI